MVACVASDPFPLSPVRVRRWRPLGCASLTGLNLVFPFFLTRALLPKLRSARGPAEVVFIGSFAGDSYLPRLTPYGASKAFLKRLSITISADERFQAFLRSMSTGAGNLKGRPESNVSTMLLNVGPVASNPHKPQASFRVATPEQYARYVVRYIGCERAVVFPFFMHAVQGWASVNLPRWFNEKRMFAALLKVVNLAKKKY